MDRPGDSQRLAPKEQQDESRVQVVSPSYRSLHLILYNSVSTLLWALVLGRVILIATIHGTRNVHSGVGEYVKWTQTLAGLEVLHAAIGLVRAPLLTTIMQVASRFLLVWGIVSLFPSVATSSPAYTCMLFAWSVTEVIRYSYFAVNLTRGRVPDGLMWLRYNTFFVLYPLGIASECWLVWLSRIQGTRKYGQVWDWFVRLVLFIYVPGAYILFTHMMAQRKKVMRGLREKKDL